MGFLRIRTDDSNKYKIKRRVKNLLDIITFSLGYFKLYFHQIIRQTGLTTRPAVEVLGKIRLYRHSDYGLLISAAIVGILVGLFIDLFHVSMGYAENLFRYLRTSSGELIGWKIAALPLVTALGGLFVGILKKTLFKGATLEGLHAVVGALVYQEGKINWKNTFQSIVCAALTISSGGGAGREGPTIVLGASLGSTFAQLFRLKPQQLRVLCGSGAAAAISGIFNAPLGGIVFALEAIIGEISIRSFTPLVIASVLATATSRLMVGDKPLLITPELASVSLQDYFFLALAGMTSGIVAYYYLKTYYWTYNNVKWSVRRVPQFLRPAIGGLIVGIVLVILPTMWETTYNPINYVIAGKGMPLIRGSMFEEVKVWFQKDNIVFLWIIVAAATIILKPFSNAVTLASGGAGGTMAPVIKVGAMYGFCFGSLLHFIYPGTSPGMYAVVCAAALFSGTYQVPLTGGIVLFEICRNYNLILPLVFSSVFASFIIQKTRIVTFNPLQRDIVDDEDKLHPVLKPGQEPIEINKG